MPSRHYKPFRKRAAPSKGPQADATATEPIPSPMPPVATLACSDINWLACSHKPQAVPALPQRYLWLLGYWVLLVLCDLGSFSGVLHCLSLSPSSIRRVRVTLVSWGSSHLRRHAQNGSAGSACSFLILCVDGHS